MAVKKNSVAVISLVIVTAIAFAVPSLLFVQPLGNYTREYFAYLNVSVGGEPDNVRINWNGTNATVYDPSLLGAWGLNGNAKDWSRYGNNGTALDGNASNSDGNTPPPFAPGRFGSGMSFDGVDDYLNVSTWTDTADGLTVEAWVYKRSSKTQDILTKKWDEADNGYRLWILGDDKLEVQFRNRTNASGYLRSAAAIPNDTWYHVAATYNGSAIMLYLNGVSDASQPFTGGIASNGYAPVIGAYIGIRDGYLDYVFNGTLDEVRVYSRAKPAEEISLTYNSELGRYYMNKTGLAEGVYSYYAWANDSTGANETDARTLTVDRTPPSWLQVPQDQTVEYGTPFYYDLNASDNFGVLQYFVNDTNFTANASTGVIRNGTLLQIGAYDINATVNDSAGNLRSGAFRVIVQDNALPTIDILVPAYYEFFTFFGVPLNFTAWDLSGISSCKYELTNTSGTPVNKTIAGCQNTTMSGTTEGTNWVRVWANDTLNNWNASANVSFTVDTTPPAISIQNPAAQTYNVTTISLNYTAWDMSGISECKYENETTNTTLAGCANTTLTGLTQGSHTIKVWANDTVNNRNFSAVTFTIDSLGPTISIQNPQNITYNTATIPLNYTASDASGLSLCRYELNGGNTTLATCQNTTLTVTEGSNTISVWANDTMNNWNATTTISFTVDTIPPTIGMQNPQNITYNTATIQLNYTAYDTGGISTCKYELTNSSSTTNTSLANCQNTTISGITEGANKIKIWANDTANNWNVSTTISFAIDTIPPTISIQNPSAQTYNTTTINLNYTAWDVSGISECKYENETTNTTLAGCANTTMTSLTQGAHTIRVWANDSVGNLNFSAVTFTIDSLGPTISIQSPANTTYNTTTITLNYTAWDISGTSTCKYELTNSTGAYNISLPSCQNTTISGITEGPNKIKIWANDTINNWNSTTIVSFTTDTTPPTISIQSPANTTYNTTTINLNYTTGDTSGTPQCKYELDGATNQTLAGCTNTTISSLTQGNHTIKIWANDTVNNRNSSAVSFTIDTLGPTITLQSPANTTYTTNTIDLNFTAYDIAGTSSCKYELTNQSGAYNTSLPNCQNTTISGITEGANKIKIWANDTTNNWNVSTTTSFTTDTTPPTISIQSPANTTYPTLNLDLNYTAGDVSGTSTCKYELTNSTGTYNQTLANCQNTTISGITEGPNKIKIWANDTINNWNSTTIVSFTTDTTPPTISIQSPANTTYNTTTINLNYTTGDTSGTPQCKYELDGATNQTLAGCTNTTISSLTQGNHTIKIWANDTVNNRNSSTVSFTIDTLGPTITIQSPAATTYNTTTISLNYTLSDPIGVSSCHYEQDAATNTTLDNCINTTISSLAQGAHTIKIWANDTQNNWNLSTISFTIDTLGPTISIQNPQNTTYNTTTIKLNYTTGDPSGMSSCRYELTNQSGAYNTSLPNCQNTTINGITEGANKIKIWANDTINNWNATTTTSFTTDTTPPTINIQSPANTTYNTTTINLNYTTWDISGTSTCKYELTNSTGTYNQTLPNCQNTTISGITEGANKIKIWANDTINNWNATTTTSFTTDTTPPTINIQSPANTTYNTTTINLNYTTWDISGTSTCKYELTNSTGTYNQTLPNCQNTTINGITEGANKIRVWANDTQNNWNASSMLSFTTDVTVPTITIQSPANTTHASTSLGLNYSAWDLSGISQCKYERDGATNITLAGCANTTISGLSQGNHTIKVWANDSVSNRNFSSVSFVVDTLGPTVTIQSPATITYNTTTVSLNYTASDPSGTSQCQYELDGAANQTLGACTNATLTGIGQGSHTLKVWANDTMNNWNASAVTFTIDTLGPKIDLQSPIATTYTSQAFWLNYTAGDPSGVSKCQYELDGNPNQTLPACGNTTITTGDGPHTIKVWANDTQNNWNASATVAFEIDTGVPAITIQSPSAAITYTNKTIDLNYTASDNFGVSVCQYELNGAANVSLPNCQNQTITAVENGNTLKVWANDTSNQWGVATVSFNVDTTPPQAFLEQLNETAFNGSHTVRFTFNTTDTYGINNCWAELTLEDGSKSNVSGSKGPSNCTVTGTITQIGDFSFRSFANDTNGHVANGSMLSGVRVLLEWGQYQQDATRQTQDGGLAYITQVLMANNTRGSVNANTSIPTGVQTRAGWACGQQVQYINVSQGTYLEIYANNCSKAGAIAHSEGSWYATGAAEQEQNISRLVNASNTDLLVSYTNVLWNTSKEPSVCWASNVTTGYLSISAGGNSSAVANMSGDCISEGAWSSFAVYGTPTEDLQNITKSRSITNAAGVAFYNVPWSASNDSSACWAAQTAASGTYTLANGIGQSLNMSGDCINQGTWAPTQVKGTPAVGWQAIASNRTATNLDADYAFNGVPWSNNLDATSCWTGGVTSGSYNLATSYFMEANRTGDCINESNANRWVQDPTKTTVVNASAYVTSNFTIKNLDTYLFSGVDLAQNITNRTGWSCPEKISSLDLSGSADLYFPQAINCTKQLVITKALANKQAYNASVVVGWQLSAFYNFTVNNTDTLPYANVFANYTENINHAEWSNTSAEQEYLSLSGNSAFARRVNVSNVTVVESWGGCAISTIGIYTKHNCTANLTVLESGLTRQLQVIYPIPTSRLVGWDLRDPALTTNVVDGTSAGVNRTEGDYGINITTNTSHAPPYSLSYGLHQVELVYWIGPPVLTYRPPTDSNGSMVDRNYTFVNVTSTHNLTSCRLEWDGVNESANVLVNSCYLNKTDASEGWHYYRVWANNSYGNWQNTTNRAIFIDTTPPVVGLSYPDGWQNTVTLAKSESDAESGISECRLEYRNSTVVPQSFGGWMFAVNYSAPCPPDANFTAYMNSVASHNRSYQLRYSARNGAGTRVYVNITNVTSLDLTVPALNLSYQDGWVNYTLNMSLVKSQLDDESGVAQCVLQYKNLSVFNNTLQGSFASINWTNLTSGNDCTVANFSGSNGWAYQFRYNVRNNVGNWSGWTGVVNTTKLDTTGPEFVDVAYPDKWYDVGQSFFYFTLFGNDSQSGIADCDLQYRESVMSSGYNSSWGAWAYVGGSEGGDCAESSFTATYGKGYQLRYRAKNYAQMWSNFTENGNISSFDNTKPYSTIVYHSGWQTTPLINITTTEADPESGIDEYDVDQRNTTVIFNAFNFSSVPWAHYSSLPPPYNYTGMHGYVYQFRYRIKNKAGMWQDLNNLPWESFNTTGIDLTAPNISLYYADGWQNTSLIPITTSYGDYESNISYCRLLYMNGTIANGSVLGWPSEWTEVGGSFCSQNSFNAPYDGQAYRFRFNVTNFADNTNDTIGNNTVYVDMTGPYGNLTYPGGWQTTIALPINLTRYDLQSGITDCDLEYNTTQLNQGNFTAWSGWVDANTTDGSDCNVTSFSDLGATLDGYAFRMRFRVRNTVGAWSGYEYNPNVTRIDTTAPNASLNYTGGWINTLPMYYGIKSQDDQQSGLLYCNISFKNISLAGDAPTPGWDAGLPWIQTTIDDCASTYVNTATMPPLGNPQGWALKIKYNVTNKAGLTNETNPDIEVWIDTTAPSVAFTYANGWRTNETINNSVITHTQSDPQSGVVECDLEYRNTSVSYGIINATGWSAWTEVNGHGGDCVNITPALMANNGNVYQLRYNVTNRANLSTISVSTNNISIDTTPPVNLSFDYNDSCYAPCWNGWRRGNEIIDFWRNGTDPESNVSCDLKYSYASATAGDGTLNAFGAWQNSGGSAWGDCFDTFNATSQGSGAGGYMFNYTIRNNASVFAPEGYIAPGKAVKLEFTPPQVNFSYPAWENNDTTIDFVRYTEYDGESGIAPDPNGCTLAYQNASLDGTNGTPTVWDPVWTVYSTSCNVTNLTGMDHTAYRYNYTVFNQAGLSTVVINLTNWTGIDTSPPSPGPNITYYTGWQTSDLVVRYNWSGNDNQSGLRDCDLEYNRTLLDHGNFTSWSGWVNAGAEGGDCNVATRAYTYTASNGYAYQFRFNIQSGAGLWYPAHYSPGNVILLDNTRPNATVRYRTTWINASEDLNLSINHTEDDQQSGLLAGNCTLQYRRAILETWDGNANLASAPWVFLTSDCSMPQPYNFTLEDRYAYQFNYTTRNINYPMPNTENSTLGGIARVDLTNATNVSVYYPEGWLNTSIIPVNRTGGDQESNISDCDIEYQRANVSFGLVGTGLNASDPWYEAGGSDGNDCNGTFSATNGYAYKLRYRARNGAGLWTNFSYNSNVTKIDNTTPVTTPTVDGVAPNTTGWYRSEKFLNLTATDPESDVNHTYYSTDFGNFSIYTAPIPIQENAHNYSFYSTNLAGMNETPQNITLRRDTTPPLITYAGHEPPSVEVNSGDTITILANITEFAGISYAVACKTNSDCYGLPLDTWCTMTGSGVTWSCPVSTAALSLGRYNYTVFARDINNWMNVSNRSYFRVRKTELAINDSSRGPVDLQATGTIVVFYRENDSFGMTHIPTANCTLSGSFGGLMVDTDDYYGKTIQPVELGANTYTVTCSKTGYATLSNTSNVSVEDIVMEVHYDPLSFSSYTALTVTNLKKMKGNPLIVPPVDVSNESIVKSIYTITSEEGEVFTGNLTWDPISMQWRANFTPDYGNYSATVTFVDDLGIEYTMTISNITGGALELTTDAPPLVQAEVGSTSLVRVFVRNIGLKPRHYNLTLEGNLNMIWLDGTQLYGRRDRVTGTVDSGQTKVHYIEIPGRMVMQQPQEIFVEAMNARSVMDNKNITIVYQIVNKPMYGMKVAPDLDLTAILLLFLAGLFYLQRPFSRPQP